MPTTTATAYYASNSGTRIKSYRYSSWTNSPKVNKKLVLRSNPHTFIRSELIRDDRKPGRNNLEHPWGSSYLAPSHFDISWSRLETRSYQQFRRKLYQGSASLGVTLGSYKQSREMIVKRYQQLRSRADEALAKAAHDVVKQGPLKAAADLHLEVIFGWMPLLSDVIAAATTVIDHPPVHRFIRATAAQTAYTDKFAYPFNNSTWKGARGEFILRSSRGARVTVSNPNLWLAERAGLLNPAAVAWDLVPWSFVVNMVSNTGVLVNSITDYAGLTIDSGYRSRIAEGVCHYDTQYYVPSLKYTGVLSYKVREKTVTLDPVAVPSLTFRIPEANWELAATAASLFAQKFGRLLRITSFR